MESMAGTRPDAGYKTAITVGHGVLLGTWQDCVAASNGVQRIDGRPGNLLVTSLAGLRLECGRLVQSVTVVVVVSQDGDFIFWMSLEL